MNLQEKKILKELEHDWLKSVIDHQLTIAVYERMLEEIKEEAKRHPIEMNLKAERERLDGSIKILNEIELRKNGVELPKAIK